MTTLSRPVSALPPGAAFARFIKGLRYGADFARAQFQDSPQVAAALDIITTKDGVGAMDMPDLERLGIYDAATAQLLAGQSAFEAARGRMWQVPFDTPTPRDSTVGVGGGWIDDNAMPATSYAFAGVKLTPALAGSIAVFTDALLRVPGAETVIRNVVIGAHGRLETKLFLDPASTATDKHPASITAEAPSVTPTGNLAVDVADLLEHIETSGEGLVWFLRPADMARLALALGPAADVPRTLLGLPIILALNGPVGQIALADLANIAYAQSPPSVERSDVATIEMDDAPTSTAAAAGGSPAGPVGTSLVSLFQTNSSAFKTSRRLNWSPRPGAVAWMNIGGSPS